MADKKVERSFRERPLTPAQKIKGSLSDQGMVNMAEPAHDKGKSALVDRFREREDRWRREQSLHAQQASGEPEPQEEAEREGGAAKSDDQGEGGD